MGHQRFLEAFRRQVLVTSKRADLPGQRSLDMALLQALSLTRAIYVIGNV